MGVVKSNPVKVFPTPLQVQTPAVLGVAIVVVRGHGRSHHDVGHSLEECPVLVLNFLELVLQHLLFLQVALQVWQPERRRRAIVD